MAEPQTSESRLIRQLASSGLLPYDIAWIEGRCFSTYRTIFSIILILVSGGLFILPLKWSIRLYSRSFFRPCPLDAATYVLIATIVTPSKKDEVHGPATTTTCSFSLASVSSGVIIHRGDRCIWDEGRFSFVWTNCILSSFFDSFSSSSSVSSLSTEEANRRLLLFGPNEISIPLPTLSSLVIEKLFSPMVLFQIASVALWLFENYWAYAITIALITIYSSVVGIRNTIETGASISKIATQSSAQSIFVIRDGMTPKLIDISLLVPGDLVLLRDDASLMLPCDGMLLRGDALVDESFLTGESVPISKTPADVHGHEPEKIEAHNNSNILFAGTKLLEAASGGTLVRVTATGPLALRGRMLKTMRYPPPIPSFALLHSDAMVFVGVLASFAAIGFIATITLLPSRSLLALIVRAGDLVTVVLPPALPASLAIGTGFALRRLAVRGVICSWGSSSASALSSPVNVAGRVDCVVFDKTGTLTENTLDILWISEARKSQIDSDSSIRLMQIASTGIMTTHVRVALATCHTLRLLDGNLVGDPLDNILFSWTKWTMEYHPHGLAQVVVSSPSIPGESKEVQMAVVRVWPFCPLLRRTTVLVRPPLPSTSSNEGTPPQLQIFVKGAPESLLSLCDPATVPDLFVESTLPSWTRKGYRVIIVAGSILSGVSWVSAQRLTRSSVESQLRFIGAVVLINALKRGSWEVVARLNRAEMTVGMATGDHAITAAAVAQQVGILSMGSDNIGSEEKQHGSEEGRPVAIFTAEMGWKDEKGNCISRLILPPPPGYIPVVGGGEALKEYLSALDKINLSPLSLVRVFARLSPDDKRLLVERIAASGSVVAFCGDGANDVAALQAADVGVSLATPSTNSVVAPFCSVSDDPRCLLDVLIQGRASLGVSFACFQFMALYSMIQFTAVSLLYLWGLNLSDGQFIWQDLGLILTLATAIARIGAGSEGLCPGRLPSRLIDARVLVSLIINVIFQIILLISLYKLSLRFLGPPLTTSPLVDSDDLSAFEKCPLNTAMFLFSNFQFVIMALLIGAWPPFQEPVYANFGMLGLSISLLAINFALLLSSDHWIVVKALGTTYIPPIFRIGAILGLVIVDVALCIIGDSFLSPFLVKSLQRWRRRRRGLIPVAIQSTC